MDRERVEDKARDCWKEIGKRLKTKTELKLKTVGRGCVGGSGTMSG